MAMSNSAKQLLRMLAGLKSFGVRIPMKSATYSDGSRPGIPMKSATP